MSTPRHHVTYHRIIHISADKHFLPATLGTPPVSVMLRTLSSSCLLSPAKSAPKALPFIFVTHTNSPLAVMTQCRYNATQWRTERGGLGCSNPPPRNSEDIGGVLDRMSKKNRRLDFLLQFTVFSYGCNLLNKGFF